MDQAKASPYMTRQEVADYFGVKPMTVYGWARANKLPEHKNGRFVRYLRTEVEAFLQPAGSEDE